MKSWFVILVVAAIGFSSHAQTLTEPQLGGINIDQKLGSKINLSLWFRDENGRDVQLSQYFGQKPVVLVLGYYKCPMLCNATFNGMIEAMQDMRWSIGQDFEVVHVSINPSEQPDLAAQKKATYLKRYARKNAGSGWHFLTGQQTQIQLLAEQTGYHYLYDPEIKQYAHPSALIILTPNGTISKYLTGVEFDSTELYSALKNATQQKVGSPIQQLILLCFSHSPTKGKYGHAVLFAARTIGVITIVSLGGLMIVMFRRDRKQPAVVSQVKSEEHVT